MKMKIGAEIEHGNERFIIVDIKHNETMEGMVLYLTAFDTNMANKEQHKQIKMEQTQEGIVDILNKLLKRGGEGGFDLNIGV